MELALPLPVLGRDPARDDADGLRGGRASVPRGERLVAEEPVPGAPGVAERAGLEEGVPRAVRVEAPEGVFVAEDAEEFAGWINYVGQMVVVVSDVCVLFTMSGEVFVRGN